MKKVLEKTMLGLCCATVLAWSAPGRAANGFIVREIKVTGLQRVSVGTVLNYLPVQVGEEIEPTSTAQIIRALYDTGFFQSVELERQANTLIVHVIERPTIGSVTVVGNKEIASDQMKTLLKELGLVKGRVYQRSALERLEKELKQAYNLRGRYNAHVESKITQLTENRIAINTTISEGRVSRIKEIKFIGNHDFSSSELRAQMSLSASNIFTYFNRKDQYSKEAMEASLEALRSFYLDRGYLKFKIISSQVLLSPDKKDVFINIHLEEGPQYRFSGFSVVGKTVLPKEKIDSLIQIRQGDVFSRKRVTESISAIGLALGDLGYGFPAINAEPHVNETDKTVFINFIIEPGRHVYVRRINFHGNTKTADYVLRNVIRQDEGALLSLHNIKESERQMRLLGYLKNVNVQTTPVPGTNNQVDLDVTVEEAPSAEASASIGYGSTGPQLVASFNQHNFMGTGRSVGVGFNASYWGRDYSFSYYDPFYTNTGVGRGINLYYQTVDLKRLKDISVYSADRLGGEVNYNVLLSEYSSLQVGYGYQDLRIKSPGIVQQFRNFVDAHGRNFHEIHLTGGWNRNTYDQMPFPTRGINQQANFLVALPAATNSLAYYKLSYMAHLYQPITHGFIFTLLGNVAYGNSFNNVGLPFFENYHAGGIAYPGMVRGYDSFSLGPKDINHNAIGGNLLVNGTAGLILPYPLSRETVRTTLFADFGNVYARGIPALFTGPDAGPVRYSAGIAVEWRSPFGPLSFSVAKPLNKQRFDETDIFQFTVSSGF
jgi:outer membrane protein insertion porin family